MIILPRHVTGYINSRELLRDQYQTVNYVPVGNQLRTFRRNGYEIWVVSQVNIYAPEILTVHPLEGGAGLGIHKQEHMDHPKQGIKLAILDKTKILALALKEEADKKRMHKLNS